MKFLMKKYILALCFTFLCLQYNYGQYDGPPPPPGCECCAGLAGSQFDPGTPLGACVDECDNDPEGDFCSDTLPLDSNIFLLFGLAITFGAYSVYQNKKRLLNN